MTEDRVKQIKEKIEALCSLGKRILLAETYRKKKSEWNRAGPDLTEAFGKEEKALPLRTSYQSWYSRAVPVIRQLAPDRSAEFEELYCVTKRKELNVLTYGISDYLRGVTTERWGETVDYFPTFHSKFKNQIDILKSVTSRIGSILSDLRSVLQSDLLDDEILSARDLYRHGHLRAAGVLAGVALEAHLKSVCAAHLIKIAKKHPTISNLNDSLKDASVVDIPKWRQIQRLGDLRNLCGHSKERDPTKEEVIELIDSVEKITKTLF